MSLLRLEGIGKKYGENRVLENVNLTIEPGEIHGLLGENGAGKSTLMNILYGMSVIHDTGGHEGKMYIEDTPYEPRSPIDAMAAGIGMVHQEFMLIPGFTIIENVKLNRENTNPNLVSRVLGKPLESLDFKQMDEDTRIAFEKLRLEFDYHQKVEGLPVGYKQFVEIAREIDKTNTKLLIVDEPTAVLTESEAEDFLNILKQLSALGIAIIFITHRLEEIKAVTNRITILRDGKHIDTLDTDQVSVSEIARLMVGRSIELSNVERRDLSQQSENAIELIDFRVAMPGEAVKGINLQIKDGEIFGIGGLAGQGKVGVANGIMGLYPTQGQMKIHGKDIPLNNVNYLLEEEVAFLSEDRKGVGLLLNDSISLNIAYTSLEVRDAFLKKFGPIKLVDKKETRKNALKMIEDLDIRCRGPEQKVGTLSGGNQQKVCIARALTFKPRILLVSEPTRGIDIGAKKLVLDTLVDLNRGEGITIIITSSELSELRQVSDRIAIITEGKLSAILPPDADDVDFGLAMSGKYKEVGA